MNRNEFRYLYAIKTFIKTMGLHPKHIKIVKVSPDITEIQYEDLTEYHRIRNETSLLKEMRKKNGLKHKVIKNEKVNYAHYRSKENYKIVADLKRKCIEYGVEHPGKMTKEEKARYEELRGMWHDKINEFRYVRNEL